MTLLMWDKPEKIMSTEAWASLYSADGAPPGVYVPNMSTADMLRWKAKLVGTRSGQPRVEVRKVTENGTQMLMVVALDFEEAPVYPKHTGDRETDKELHARYREARAQRDRRPANVRLSMNGPAFLSFEDMEDMRLAIQECVVVLRATRS